MVGGFGSLHCLGWTRMVWTSGPGEASIDCFDSDFLRRRDDRCFLRAIFFLNIGGQYGESSTTTITAFRWKIFGDEGTDRCVDDAILVDNGRRICDDKIEDRRNGCTQSRLFHFFLLFLPLLKSLFCEDVRYMLKQVTHIA